MLHQSAQLVSEDGTNREYQYRGYDITVTGQQLPYIRALRVRASDLQHAERIIDNLIKQGAPRVQITEYTGSKQAYRAGTLATRQHAKGRA